MNWGGWHEFVNMGGYARYVWGAYGMVALAVVIEIVGVRMRLARALRAGRTRRARVRSRQ
ncbi:MAG TPA: heme exporter protein CcmD [Burkholderiaceae bacterium]|nr:heme exporter protein CcmD [Burkholderiaceae bacterium]